MIASRMHVNVHNNVTARFTFLAVAAKGLNVFHMEQLHMVRKENMARIHHLCQ